MLRIWLFSRFVVPLLVTAVHGEIPKTILAEQNLEKRSELALQEADDQIGAAAKTYAGSGSAEAFHSHLESVRELAQYSIKALQDTGKTANKKPKFYKRAELKLRALLRRLDMLEKDVSADDRAAVEKVKNLVSETHEQVLLDIMSKR